MQLCNLDARLFMNAYTATTTSRSCPHIIMDQEENALSSQLIPLVGKLMDAVQATGTKSIDLALPQIVVVGSQSAGV